MKSVILATDPWSIVDCCYELHLICEFVQSTGVAVSSIELWISARDRTGQYIENFRVNAENLVSGRAYECADFNHVWNIYGKDNPYQFEEWNGDKSGFEYDVFVKSIQFNNAEFVEFSPHEVKVDWDG